MPHPLFELETKIRAYITEEITLQDLRSWFAGAKGPLLALPASLQVSRQAGLVELGLIETQDGALPESDLRMLLKAEVDTAMHFVVEGNPELTFSASVTTVHTHSVERSESDAAPATLHQETLVDIGA